MIFESTVHCVEMTHFQTYLDKSEYYFRVVSKALTSEARVRVTLLREDCVENIQFLSKTEVSTTCRWQTYLAFGL